MRLCGQCKTIHYCGPECQRSDWPRHKRWCKTQASRLVQEVATGGHLVADFEAWRVAMTPTLFGWICIYGLAVYDHPEHIKTKFVLLSLRPRLVRPSSALKMFEYENVEVIDRAAAEEDGLLGDDQIAIQQMTESFRQQEASAERRGMAGVAVLLVRISGSGDDRFNLLRCMPVILSPDVLEYEPMDNWKSMVRWIIDEGKSIKRQIARREKTGELQKYLNSR
ncbi:hypothetical protein DFH06DRAFT_1321086 [Mycena polygramma]|nr:hypothetical protein DFH06DRAFT_1321086 [Mycena polygramma]